MGDSLCRRNAIALNDANRKKTLEKPNKARGKLKIGDDWNAITIIALSQSNPLKAIAEQPNPIKWPLPQRDTKRAANIVPARYPPDASAKVIPKASAE